MMQAQFDRADIIFSRSVDGVTLWKNELGPTGLLPDCQAAEFIDVVLDSHSQAYADAVLNDCSSF